MSVLKLFLSNALLIVLLNLLIKPFYLFGIDVQIQNTVGSDNYGLYFSLLNLSFVFNMLLDMGTVNFNTKTIAQHPQLVTRYTGSILGTRLVLALLYAAITIGSGLTLGYTNKELELLSLLVMNQFLAGLIQFFRSNFAGLHLFKTDALLSVLDRFILITTCLFLLYSSSTKGKFEIEWLVYAQTFSYGLTALFAGCSLYFKTKFKSIKYKRLFTFALIKKSYPYALLILFMMLYTRIDAVMLERILSDGKEQSGIYAQGFRLLDAANIFGLLLANLLLPIFSRLLQQKDPIQPLLENAGLLLIGVSTTLAMITSLFAPTIFELIYTHNTEASSQIFPWIIFSFIPICGAYLFGTLLTANGNLRQLNSMAISALILNIILNLILIPPYKAEGAAIATLITQVFAGLFQAFLALKVFQFNIKYKAVGKLLFHSIFIMASFLATTNFTSNNLIISFTIVSLTGVISLFLFRIISFSTLKSLIVKR